MSICLARIGFHLHGCRSLKEKRARLAGLRDRFGRQANLAVFESHFQDALQQAQWTLVAGAADARAVEQLLTAVERDIQLLVDAEVVDIERRWLD